MRPFMRWRWRAGDATHLAVRAVDTATHPEWRRRGIFRRLTEAALEEAAARDVDFVFNTPNARSLPGYLEMGWKRVGRVRVRVKPLRPLRALGRFVRHGASTAVPPPPTPAGDLLGSVNLGPFLGSWEGQRRLHTPRTLAYLRWRYASVPGLRYGAALEGDGDSGALVVYRLRRRWGAVELTVCELLLDARAGAVGAAVGLLDRLGAESGADHAVAVAPSGTPESKALSRAGFLPIPGIGPLLVVRSLGGGVDLPDLLDVEHWRLAAGDIELF